MIRITLSLFIVLGGCFKSFGQNMKLFPDSANWTISVTELDIGDCYERYLYSYLLSSDTTIDLKTYRKLSCTGSIALENGTPCGFATIPTTGPIGFLREDTLIKAVYFRSSTDTVDNLLFDYEMNVGDTVAPLLSALNETVVSIDSVSINGIYHKRWNLSSHKIIEGIGTSAGLLENVEVWLGGNSTLLCLGIDGEFLYSFNGPPQITCSLIVPLGVQESNSKGDLVSLFPNPSSGKFSSKNISYEAQITVFNNVGISVLKTQSVHQELDLSNLPSGMYFVKIAGSIHDQMIKVVVTGE